MLVPNMGKITATFIFGMLLAQAAWTEQQEAGLVAPKRTNNEDEVRTEIAKKTGGVQQSGPLNFAEEAAVLAAAQAQAEALAAAQALTGKINKFNRTMRLPTTYNLPPVEDGIHDASIESIKMLNTPLAAYADLPLNKAGNRVDWVTALAAKKIVPRWDIADTGAEAMVMDMDIVRLTKGTIPNVVFPHKQHTEWLACANCHPAIFLPQKGANQISMPLILSGQKCGICHGTVAFPPSECSKCHSQKKKSAL